jgi:hypothetical protein
MAGWPDRPAEARQGPGTTVLRVRRTAFGLIRVRTDDERLLVFSDTGKRDVKEAYAYDIPPAGEPRPSSRPARPPRLTRGALTAAAGAVKFGGAR